MGREKLTTQEFIRRAKDVHGDKYDYSKTRYISYFRNVEIICPKHGSFWQRPANHIHKKYGCPKCKGERTALRCRNTTEDFIRKAQEVHGNKYDYSKVDYTKLTIPVTIICPIHGEFTQLPSNHIKGEGCYKCGRDITNKSKSLSVDEIIDRANAVHNNFYDYSLINRSYKHLENMPVICPKHGLFYQSMNNHLAGEGCPKCRRSKGEKEITTFLENHNISFEAQYRIPCSLDDQLYCFIDFYIPHINTFIEYNGRQHYEAVDRFGGNDTFVKQQKRDEYVRNYCNTNNINLLEINYKDSIQEKLNNLLYGKG